MERFTVRTRSEKKALLALKYEEVYTQDELIDVLLDKLATYEDEEEQGRLIRLPCPIDTKIYLIVTKRARSYSTKQFRFIKISQLTWRNLETVLRNFGKTVFLDRNEAEAAMERMNKEEKDGEHS